MAPQCPRWAACGAGLAALLRIGCYTLTPHGSLLVGRGFESSHEISKAGVGLKGRANVGRQGNEWQGRIPQALTHLPHLDKVRPQYGRVVKSVNPLQTGLQSIWLRYRRNELPFNCQDFRVDMKLNFVTRSRRWLSKHLAIPASEERCTPSTNSHVGQTVSWEDQAAERDDWKKRPLSPCTTPLSRKISSRSQQTASTAPASNYSADAGLSSPRSIPDVDHISEDDSYGIRVLHDPKPAAIVDIVFIHGLTGNSFRTWFHEPSGIHWPGDLLKEDLPDARVMTFGYDADVAHLVKHAALESISGYSNDLLASLAGIRQGVEVSCYRILKVSYPLRSHL